MGMVGLQDGAAGQRVASALAQHLLLLIWAELQIDTTGIKSVYADAKGANVPACNDWCLQCSLWAQLQIYRLTEQHKCPCHVCIYESIAAHACGLLSLECNLTDHRLQISTMSIHAIHIHAAALLHMPATFCTLSEAYVLRCRSTQQLPMPLTYVQRHCCTRLQLSVP